MIAMLGSLSDALAIVPPQSTPLGLLLRHFEPFLAPDPLHLLVVHPPALSVKEGRDPAVAVAAVISGELDDASYEPRLSLTDPDAVSLRRSRLSEYPASPTLRDTEQATDMLDCSASPDRAQNFPELTSFRMALSSAWSATSFLSRAFSFSSSFRRLA